MPTESNNTTNATYHDVSRNGSVNAIHLAWERERSSLLRGLATPSCGVLVRQPLQAQHLPCVMVTPPRSMHSVIP